MSFNIVGWDIGGAHLKAAVIDDRGKVLQVFQKACPLWRGLHELRQAVNFLLEKMIVTPTHHILTMTGELVDLFSSREQGVKKIIATMQQCLGDRQMLIFAAPNVFLRAEQVSSRHCEQVASANWLASVCYAAAKIDNALFVDIGSTTTDILSIVDGSVMAQGMTDYQRLCSGELVYTGIVRTPVMAIADNVLFEGRQVGLMAEYFATMADVYRLTGELNELHDQSDTADGGEKTVPASARRLSRMIGCDFMDSEISRWRLFADNIRSLQFNKIDNACETQLAAVSFAQQPCFIGAGIGRFLVEQLAEQKGYRYRDCSGLFRQQPDYSEMAVADCVAAVSVACLAIELF